jgi:hypothetical protein
MTRIRLLAIGTMLTFALTAVARQATRNNDTHGTVEAQQKMLTERLELTADQQTRITPILNELHDSTQRILQDESMSRDERFDNVKACRYKTNREIRQILNDDQKKKLDQVEQEPHPELHGDTNASTPPPAQ